MPTQFIFRSGVGNWRTVLNIDKDGSFTGEFFQILIWALEAKIIPMAQRIYVDFNGKFSTPKKD